jgi:hypothetical protein
MRCFPAVSGSPSPEPPARSPSDCATHRGTAVSTTFIDRLTSVTDKTLVQYYAYHFQLETGVKLSAPSCHLLFFLVDSELSRTGLCEELRRSQYAAFLRMDHFEKQQSHSYTLEAGFLRRAMRR